MKIELSPEDRQLLVDLMDRIRKLDIDFSKWSDQLNDLSKTIEDKITRGDYEDKKIRNKKHDELSRLKKSRSDYSKTIDKFASFDSELMLILRDSYSLNMWIPNPFYLGYKDSKLVTKKSEVLMTSRLDGADAAIVKRIINDSIEAEKEGLKNALNKIREENVE